MHVKIKCLSSEFVLQMAVIEYSRNILGYTQANSTEMNEGTPHPVVNLMEEQKNVTDKVEQCV
jgi:CTP synthase